MGKFDTERLVTLIQISLLHRLMFVWAFAWNFVHFVNKAEPRAIWTDYAV
jgi:hypothetical protein